MAILGSAIKIKDDIVACISVMKNYDDRSKRKLFIGDTTRSIFVKIKFMNSEDKRFVVVSDNITDEILADVKQSIEDYKERSTLFEEMSRFQFCEHVRDMLARAFMIESEFDYLRNTDQIREYFDLVHKKSSWRINWKPSNKPLQIIKDTVDTTFTVQSRDIESILNADDLKWLNFSTKDGSVARSMTVINDKILLLSSDASRIINTRLTFIDTHYSNFDEIQNVLAQYLIDRFGMQESLDESYIARMIV